MAKSTTSPFEQLPVSGEKVISSVHSFSEIALATYKKSFEAMLVLGGELSSAAAGMLTQSLDAAGPLTILQRQSTFGGAAVSHTQAYVTTAREILSDAQKDLGEIASTIMPAFAKSA